MVGLLLLCIATIFVQCNTFLVSSPLLRHVLRKSPARCGSLASTAAAQMAPPAAALPIQPSAESVGHNGATLPPDTTYLTCSRCRAAFVAPSLQPQQRVACSVCKTTWTPSANALFKLDSSVRAVHMTQEDIDSFLQARSNPAAETHELFVTNLPTHYNEMDIVYLFSEYGITNMVLVRKPVEDTTVAAFAFVRLESIQARDQAALELNGFFVGLQRRLKVDIVNPELMGWRGSKFAPKSPPRSPPKRNATAMPLEEVSSKREVPPEDLLHPILPTTSRLASNLSLENTSRLIAPVPPKSALNLTWTAPGLAPYTSRQPREKVPRPWVKQTLSVPLSVDINVPVRKGSKSVSKQQRADSSDRLEAIRAPAVATKQWQPTKTKLKAPAVSPLATFSESLSKNDQPAAAVKPSSPAATGGTVGNSLPNSATNRSTVKVWQPVKQPLPSTVKINVSSGRVPSKMEMNASAVANTTVRLKPNEKSQIEVSQPPPMVKAVSIAKSWQPPPSAVNVDSNHTQTAADGDIKPPAATAPLPLPTKAQPTLAKAVNAWSRTVAAPPVDRIVDGQSPALHDVAAVDGNSTQQKVGSTTGTSTKRWQPPPLQSSENTTKEHVSETVDVARHDVVELAPPVVLTKSWSKAKSAPNPPATVPGAVNITAEPVSTGSGTNVVAAAERRPGASFLNKWAAAAATASNQPGAAKTGT